MISLQETGYFYRLTNESIFRGFAEILQRSFAEIAQRSFARIFGVTIWMAITTRRMTPLMALLIRESIFSATKYRKESFRIS